MEQHTEDKDRKSGCLENLLYTGVAVRAGWYRDLIMQIRDWLEDFSWRFKNQISADAWQWLEHIQEDIDRELCFNNGSVREVDFQLSGGSS